MRGSASDQLGTISDVTPCTYPVRDVSRLHRACVQASLTIRDGASVQGIAPYLTGAWAAVGYEGRLVGRQNIQLSGSLH